MPGGCSRPRTVQGRVAGCCPCSPPSGVGVGRGGAAGGSAGCGAGPAGAPPPRTPECNEHGKVDSPLEFGNVK